MLFGTLHGIQVMLMQGRFHAYEGYSLSKVRTTTRVSDASSVIFVTECIVLFVLGGHACSGDEALRH